MHPYDGSACNPSKEAVCSPYMGDALLCGTLEKTDKCSSINLLQSKRNNVVWYLDSVVIVLGTLQNSSKLNVYRSLSHFCNFLFQILSGISWNTIKKVGGFMKHPVSNY